ncbi:MAG: caspase family protein, partial [Microvirga sp.]
MPLADRALVVGINRYPGISTLQGAEADAQDFYTWVTSPAGGKVDPKYAVKILSSGFPLEPDPDKAEPATTVILDFFTGVDKAADENNEAGFGAVAGKRLWLFFSGHGFAPSLDRSGVLTANASARRVHNIAARMWADRLYEGGWFQEVLLFQDACRQRIRAADLSPPFLAGRVGSGERRRFYAFAASNDKLAKEVPLPSGRVGGVFAAALLDGLRGGARHPITGAVTTAQLAEYLQANMRKLLPAADLDDDDIAKVPDVYAPDPFDIVPAPAGGAAVGAAAPHYAVRIVVRQPGSPGRVLDAAFE